MPGYEITADGDIVGHIMLSGTAAQGSTPWTWTIAFPHHGDRSPTEGHEATAVAAMQAFSRELMRQLRPQIFDQIAHRLGDGFDVLEVENFLVDAFNLSRVDDPAIEGAP
jgi:hypothetical protein